MFDDTEIFFVGFSDPVIEIYEEINRHLKVLTKNTPGIKFRWITSSSPYIISWESKSSSIYPIYEMMIHIKKVKNSDITFMLSCDNFEWNWKMGIIHRSKLKNLLEDIVDEIFINMI